MNFGFIEPEIALEDWTLGGVVTAKKKIINPERNWMGHIPLGEVQERNIETSSCTEYGTLNCIETLEHKLFGEKTKNYSERFVAIGAGNSFTGNDPHTVAEWIRKNGLVDELSFPFTDGILTWEEYILEGQELPVYMIQEAKRWLQKKSFNHEYVFTKDESQEVKNKKLMEALLYSPIGISVVAWHQTGKLYTKTSQEQDNHWCALIGAKEGEYWTVYDSYIADGEYIKKLAWNYNFSFAKLYVINKIPQKGLLGYLTGLFPWFSNKTT